MTNDAQYCVASKISRGFVERITFDDCGVKIDFTGDEHKAAHVSLREVAVHLAGVVPCGSVRVWNGKPSPSTETKR